jgi:hypothetical protein
MAVSHTYIDDVSVKKCVSSVLTPTNFAIELTNTTDFVDPVITIAAGSLSVNSVVLISNIDDAQNVIILDDYDSEVVRIHKVLEYIKSSIGWLPVADVIPS